MSNYAHIPGWFDRYLQRFMPTPQQVAESELKDAELQILVSQTQSEAAALAKAMHDLTVMHHAQRIERLKEFLGHDAASKIDFTAMPFELPEDIKDVLWNKPKKQVYQD